MVKGAGSKGPDDGFSPDARALLREVALRGRTAVRLDADVETALLRSIVDATVGIFRAEAASIALLDEASGNLKFVVAAGAQGEPVVGLTIPPSQGLAGYVFSTGESIALSDPAKDPRFGRGVAESTGFMPRSILAVPLEDGDRTVGVLEVIDKLGGPFSMEDIGIASLFARQAATAIRVAARAREIRVVLADVLASDEETGTDAAVREVVSAATRRHAGDDRFWDLVDAIADMRHASVADRDLAIELLTVIGRHGAATSRKSTGRRLRARR